MHTINTYINACIDHGYRWSVGWQCKGKYPVGVRGRQSSEVGQLQAFKINTLSWT